MSSGLGWTLPIRRCSPGLAGMLEYRAWRAEEIGRRLAKKGIEGAYDGAKALSNGRLIGRTHFARFLVEQRLAADERRGLQALPGQRASLGMCPVTGRAWSRRWAGSARPAARR